MGKFQNFQLDYLIWFLGELSAMKTGLKYLKLEWINQKNYWEGEIFKSFNTHST